MAQEQGVGFLGRVPIDTKLVELLDEVVKGNIPVGDDIDLRVDQVSIKGEAKQDAQPISDAAAPTDHLERLTKTSQVPFPLFERYMETTSSKIWKTITDDILARLEERKALAQAELDDAEGGSSEYEDEETGQ